jgi:hypothetical protein
MRIGNKYSNKSDQRYPFFSTRANQILLQRQRNFTNRKFPINHFLAFSSIPLLSLSLFGKTHCTMKLSAITLLLLLSASSLVDASNKHPTTTATLEYDDQRDIVERMLQQGKKGGMMSGGKKGGMNGGKKGDGDCIDGTTKITSCGTTISLPGCYVLTGDLMCDEGQNGILIEADNVHLDCQDFEFRGPATFGIVVDSVDHVTVANCGAENFVVGLVAEGLLTDFTVRSSSFNNNIVAGMSLFGDAGTPSDITVVDSTFNGNGNSAGGYGIYSENFRGTISSSTMNNNIGTDGGGLEHRGTGAFTLVDIEAVGNEDNGLFAGEEATLNIINSIACSNGNDDIFKAGTTQGLTTQTTTCDTSTPATIGGSPVCQFSCY